MHLQTAIMEQHAKSWHDLKLLVNKRKKYIFRNCILNHNLTTALENCYLFYSHASNLFSCVVHPIYTLYLQKKKK